MFKGLSYIQKNKLLWPVAGVGILLCWFLAFSRTFEAAKLHGELMRETEVTGDLSYNPAHMQKKLEALRGILKSYRVSPENWSNELWMKASAMAMKNQSGIDYTVSKPLAERDTTTLGNTETIYCYGHYIQLVKLIDTLERSPGIGKISGLQIRSPKEDVRGERAGMCMLKMEFKGLTDL
ncbi:hypothetical protein SAMN06265348_103278 [Pedobacter westerhofensis]|uniref:Uncharacterized protein n=1 Tax=Pedobacter westerhofensis TaxID=425512 RepID=A0A521C6T7_9SPHI|nr:hypothetical protein [Pedobacter westerhofensis]SMO55146.1 hypothetical protein SAMN06265348_103278 [Pedobacter westerhofensis]